MNENELREIEELKNELVIIGDYLSQKIDWDRTARENYKNGIRKIHEGEVVMTKEKYAEFREHWHKEYKDGVNWGSKETAREILNDLKGLLDGYVHTKENISLYEQYCQKYGVEVDE